MRLVAEVQRVGRTIFYLSDHLNDEKPKEIRVIKPHLPIAVGEASVGGLNDDELADEEELDELRNAQKELKQEEELARESMNDEADTDNT